MQLPDRFVRTAVGDLDAETVDLVYDRLLAPVFRPEELLPREDLRATYGPGADSPSAVLLEDGRPAAVMLGEWFLDRRVLLLCYLSVSGQARGAGLGTVLLTTVLPTWWDAAAHPPLVLAEVDDPSVWSGDELGGDPRARLRFYERHGAALAPLPYVQPSMRGPGGRVPGMLLLRLGGPPGVSPVPLAELLREYYVRREGPGALDDPDVAPLLARAQEHDPGEWWEVSRWPEVRRGGVDDR